MTCPRATIEWAIATAKHDPYRWSHEHMCTPLRCLLGVAESLVAQEAENTATGDDESLYHMAHTEERGWQCLRNRE